MNGDHFEPAAPDPTPAQASDLTPAQTTAQTTTQTTGPTPAAPALPPETGDPDIDAVLADVAAAQTGDLADRIAAGEHAHDALQSRLRDLGGA